MDRAVVVYVQRAQPIPEMKRPGTDRLPLFLGMAWLGLPSFLYRWGSAGGMGLAIAQSMLARCLDHCAHPVVSVSIDLDAMNLALEAGKALAKGFGGED
jgi:hypothetical protein